MTFISILLAMIFLPPESIMPFIGYAYFSDYGFLLGTMTAGTVGSTLGSTMLYLLARSFNNDTTNTLIDKRGRWLGINKKSTKTAGKLFDRHAKTTVFAGRFIPGIRSAVSIPAGFQRMPIGSFITYTALGSGANIILLMIFGNIAGENYILAQTIAAYVLAIILLVFFLLTVFILLRRFARKRA